MTAFAIPGPRQQELPGMENLFKGILLIALLFASFYATTGIVTMLDVTEAVPRWVAMVLKWMAAGLLATGDVILRIGDRRYTGRAVKDAGLIAVIGLTYFGLVPALGISLFVTVVPILALFPVVFAFRALSDHYGIPPVVREIKKREDVLDADEES